MAWVEWWQNVAFDRVEELHLTLDDVHLRLTGYQVEGVLQEITEQFVVGIEKTDMAPTGTAHSSIPCAPRPHIVGGLHSFDSGVRGDKLPGDIERCIG